MARANDNKNSPKKRTIEIKDEECAIVFRNDGSFVAIRPIKISDSMISLDKVMFSLEMLLSQDPSFVKMLVETYDQSIEDFKNDSSIFEINTSTKVENEVRSDFLPKSTKKAKIRIPKIVKTLEDAQKLVGSVFNQLDNDDDVDSGKKNLKK